MLGSSKLLGSPLGLFSNISAGIKVGVIFTLKGNRAMVLVILRMLYFFVFGDRSVLTRFVFAATDYICKSHDPSTCACRYVSTQDFFYEPVVGLSQSPLGFVVGVYKVSQIVDQNIYFGKSRLADWATGCCTYFSSPLPDTAVGILRHCLASRSHTPTGMYLLRYIF